MARQEWKKLPELMTALESEMNATRGRRTKMPLYHCILTALGNGDKDKGTDALVRIAYRLWQARHKHSWPQDTLGADDAYAALVDETVEMGDAIRKQEGRQREQDEALDVIAVAVRFMNGEHMPESE